MGRRREKASRARLRLAVSLEGAPRKVNVETENVNQVLTVKKVTPAGNIAVIVEHAGWIESSKSDDKCGLKSALECTYWSFGLRKEATRK